MVKMAPIISKTLILIGRGANVPLDLIRLSEQMIYVILWAGGHIG